MRTLIVGAGAVGGFFGGNLLRAGRDVTFLVREGRERALRENGLVVRNDGGEEFRTTPKTVTAATIAAPFDLVLLSVKAYGLDQAIADLDGAIGDNTMVLPTLNGMRHLDVLREHIGAEKTLGGVCIIASELGSDGVIRQLGPGASLSYGEFDGSSSARIREVDATLSDAGFDAILSQTIELDMWEKWLMLASGGALTTLLRGPVGAIEAVPGGVDAALGIVAECVAVIEASGFSPRQEFVTRVEGILTKPGSPFTTSLYRDQLAGNRVEADQIVGDLVARGQRLGVPVPRLSLAYAALCVYQNRIGQNRIGQNGIEQNGIAAR